MFWYIDFNFGVWSYVTVLTFKYYYIQHLISCQGKRASNLFFCFQALAVMEVAHGKDHHYVAEVKHEIEEQK